MAFNLNRTLYIAPLLNPRYTNDYTSSENLQFNYRSIASSILFLYSAKILCYIDFNSKFVSSTNLTNTPISYLRAKNIKCKLITIIHRRFNTTK